MNIIINLIILILSILGASYILPGVKVASLWTIIILALVISLLNVVVKPILLILMLPINILTLGLFTFIINAFIIMIASFITKGFSVDNFWWALLFSILISIITYFLEKIIK
ncbi:MAG TPA: phage holin family protein [Candidatus Pacearchaeota archaeon]|nr:phage holin family protein [Candidatus Pacearchaeota archaeon]